ncbi:MAG: R3H domain-containing nucleic acid-binding protein [Patescibacteria group bacterium]
MLREAHTILEEFLAAMGAQYSGISEASVAGQTVLTIAAEDAKLLIGAHGDTIHAIDFLVKRILEQRRLASTLVHEGASPEEPHFLIDVNDYRARQIRDLQSKALMMAERARSFQYDVELSPMSAYERLIVHTTLQDAPNVKTESQGEGRNRRVVIRYTSTT